LAGRFFRKPPLFILVYLDVIDRRDREEKERERERESRVREREQQKNSDERQTDVEKRSRGEHLSKTFDRKGGHLDRKGAVH
jgi:hypothetical protein